MTALIWLKLPDDVPADNHFFHFLGPFINFQDLGGPIEALDVLIVEVTIAAVELQGFIDDLHGRSPGEHLGHGGCVRIAFPLVQNGAGFMGDGSGQFHLGAISAILNWVA